MANPNPFFSSPYDKLTDDLTEEAAKTAAANSRTTEPKEEVKTEAPKPEKTEKASAPRASGNTGGSAPTRDDVIRRAQELDVDPKLALSIWSQESGRNANVRDSSKGARGGFQVMPDTFKAMLGDKDQRDPWNNMEAGLRYLAYGQKTLGTKDPALLAAGYHAGYDRDSLKRGEIPDTTDGAKRTRDYAREVAARVGGKDAPEVVSDSPGFPKMTPLTDAEAYQFQQTGKIDNRFVPMSDEETNTFLTQNKDNPALKGIVAPKQAQPTPMEAKAPDRNFFEEYVTDPLKRGWSALKQETAATGAMANARQLEVIGRIDRGEKVPDADDMAGYQYMNAEQRAQYKAMFADSFKRGAEKTAEYGKEVEAIPQDPIVAKAGQAKSFGEWWDAFKQAPMKVIAQTGVESLPQMIPGLVAGGGAGAAAKVGLKAGGLVAGAAGMGAGSYAVDYPATVLGVLADKGIDVRDPEALSKAFSDPKLMEQVGREAHAHATVVGAMDAVSGGRAGATLVPGKTLAREAANLGAKTVEQGVLGAAGEAGGQIAQGKKELEWGNIMGEFAGEFAGAPVEIAGAAKLKGKEALEARREAAAEQAGVGVTPTQERVEPTMQEPAPTPASATQPVPESAVPSKPTDTPLTSAVENAAAAPDRAVVTSPNGVQAVANVQGYVENPDGSFAAQLVDDDGNAVTLTDKDGVKIAPVVPESGPLTSSVEKAAAQEAAQPTAPVAEAPAEPAAAPAAPPAAAPEQPAAPRPAKLEPPKPADMTDAQLRERMKYLAGQFKNASDRSVQTKIAVERRAIEREINQRAIAAPAETPKAETPAAPEPTEFKTRADANAAMLRAAERTGQPHEVVEKGDQFAVQPIQEAKNADARNDDDGGRGAGRADRSGPTVGDGAVPDRGVHDGRGDVAGDARPGDNRVPQGDADAARTADAKPALTEAAPAEKDAHAGKWFGSQGKADAYLAKKKIAATHEVVQTGKVRFEVKPKAAEQAAPATIEQQVQDFIDGKRDTPPEVPAAAPTKRRGEVGGKLASGETVLTASGRETTPFPKIKTDTERKTGNTLKAVDQWLMQNALEEARSRGDDFNARQFEASQAKPSQADKDSAEEYLFGQQPDVLPSILKPLSTKPAAEKVPEVAPAPVADDENTDTTKAIERAKRRLRETRNAIDTTGVREQRQELQAREQEIEREIRELRRKAVEEDAPAAPPAAEAVSAPAAKDKNAIFAANKLFTADKVEAARARMKSKMGQLNSGLDPELMVDGVVLAGAYIEAGVRKFADYAKAMRADFGDKITPYLLSFYEGVRHYPGLDTDGMSTPRLAQSQHEAMMLELEEGAKTQTSPTMKAKEAESHDVQRDQEDAGAGVQGQAAEPVRADEGGRDAGSVPAEAGGRRGQPGERGAQRAAERPAVPVDQRSDATDAGSEQPDQGGRGGRAEPGDRGTERRLGNYRIAQGELTRAGSWRATAERNVGIVELVKKIEAEGRQATPAERAELVKFTGWGASEIANGVFPDRYGRYKNTEWQALGERLKAALSDEEYAQARRTTQYAHYTSESVIRSIYSGLDRMGFKGGTVVEPGMGVGHFAGLMPDAMAANSTYTGVEYEPITGAIAKLLYPQSNIIVGDFTKTSLPRDFFDAAIGNPPFSSSQVLNDPEYKSQRPMLHDYFFMKTIDRVKPGGLLVFVTSKGTMDKTSDKSRKYLAERANLLGAIRLPQTAFKDNAGTEVVTDVIFLQKRGPGIADNGVQWLGTKDVPTPQGATPINEYFADHPEMVLGRHALEGSMYRANEYTVLPLEGDIEQHFAEAIKRLPENVARAVQGSAAERAIVQDRDFNPNHKKEGGLYVNDGKLMQVESGSGIELTHRVGSDGKAIALTPKQKKWLRDYVGVRDALKQTQLDQLTDGNWQKSLKALNKAYDAFVAEHGPILDYTVIETKRTDDDGNVTVTETKRYKNDPLLRLDVEGALAHALERIREDGTIEKGAALNGRVLEKSREPEIKTTQDAMFVSLNRHGMLNLDDVAQLAGTDRESVIRDLGTAIYEAPGKGWQLADEYLSGNVVKKLAEARAAAEINPAYKRNVDALLAVQPRPLGPTEITVRLGANWVPASDIAAFAQEAIGDKMTVTYSPLTGQWNVDQHTFGASEYAFNKMSAGDILASVLNARQLKVTFRDQEGKTHTDLEATEKANDIAGKMRERFRSWLWADPKRADRLVKHYNQHFNNIAPRAFDGSHLTLPGVSSRYKLHPHQKRAVWRVIQQGDTYLAHAVGSGKTMEMIASGMEERRLGLINKPMYVVPNHMLAQFAREFLELYPAANIMVADEQNFHTHNRKRFVAQAALNNPDAIVITHSAFGRIGMSEEYSSKFINDQIEEWKSALEDVDKGDRITVKQIERRIEQLERRLEGKQGKDKKDQVLTFEELGIDKLYVDEFHEFRKLDFATNQGNVKGIDPNGSQRALDLYMKVQFLREKKPGRSLVAASGTPVTNTMGELFTAQRFFQPEQLKEDGLDTFDAWSAQYGDIVTGFEQNAAGGYEMVNRFAKFQNVPELMRRVRSFMDILTSNNLGALVKRPDVEGGGRQVVVTPTPDGYKEYQQTLQSRIQAIRNRKGPPKKGEDIILNVIGDGRFSAIDMRFVDPTLPSDPKSKLNVWIDDIIAAYQRTAGNEYHAGGKMDPLKGSTIIGFTDIGLGEQSAEKRGFDMKGWIEKRFADAGIPREHVAFMRDHKQHAKKERLFADMREGKRRILIGGKDMETGVNVQKRLTDLFHLDAPWFPSSVEQREGRAVRQGNQNQEVRLKAYATKGSYDSTMWGMNARKARFIEQAMNGDDSVRSMDDVSEASAFEMASALASGDERYLKMAGLKADVERFERLRHAHYSDQNSLRREKHWAEDQITRSTAYAKELEEAIAKRKPIRAGEFAGTVGKQSYDSRDEFSEALFKVFKKAAEASTTDEKTLGEIGGFPITFHGVEMKGSGDYLASLHVGIPGDPAPILSFPFDPDVAVSGLATRAANQVNGLDRELAQTRARADEAKRKVEQIGKRLGAEFPEEQILLEKLAELSALQEELAKEGEQASADAAAATVAVDPHPETDGEEPRYSVRDGVTQGEFGPVHTEYRDDPAGAIERLLADKTGEAIVDVPGLGDVSLIYGDEKAGLGHIARRRGAEFMARLPRLLKDGTLYSKPGQKDRVFVGTERDEAVVRFEWDGKAKTWLLSAYEKYPDLKPAASPQQSVRADVVQQRTGLTKDGLQRAVTGGVLGNVIRSMIDAGVVVLHDSPKTLPVGIGKGIRGVQAVTAPDGTIHMVAANLTARNARAVMLHEAFHQGGEKLIGTKNWSEMMGRLGSLYRQSEQSSGKAREFFDRARARVADAKARGAVKTSLEVEEFAAYAIEEYESDPRSLPAAIRKWVEDVIALVKTWALQRFGKQLGDVTPAQLAAMAKMAIMDVATARRGEIFGPVAELFSAAGIKTVEINGQRRPIEDSTGRPIAEDMNKQLAFYRWFGDSKVVDEAGRPLVVYHGTGKDFGRFDTRRNDLGSHFGTIEQANQAAGGKAAGAVLPVYLSIENPLRIVDRGDFNADTIAQQLEAAGVITKAQADELFNAAYDEDVKPRDLIRQVQRHIEKAGYDGVVYLNRQEGLGADHTSATVSDDEFRAEHPAARDSWIAFRPEQIKSAIGNAGTFDPDNADIRYSIAGANGQQVELTPPEDTSRLKLRQRFGDLQSAIQDNMNRVKQVQNRITKLAGRVINEASDYYGAETNRPGRIAARLEDAEKHLFAPLMQRLAKSGHTQAELSELLHAMHAKERNEAVAKINPAMPDGGSGMKTADAAKILARYAGKTELHAMAQQARDIARATLDLKLAYGLIDGETHAHLSEMYEHYVPLKGDGEYGPKVKRAMGHDEREEHILENIARDYDQAVVVGEKNLARQSLLRLVLNNPDPDLWTVGVPPKGRYVAGKVYNLVRNGQTEATFTSRAQVDAFLEAKGPAAVNYQVQDSAGEQVREFVRPLQENEVMVYVKGDPVRIQIMDERLARQIRPLDGQKLGFFLEKARGINRYLSKIYTGYNPAFILRNATRDAMTGTINMIGHQGAATAAKAWTKYPQAAKALAQWAATGKAPAGEFGQMLTEYRQHGGKTGASYMSDLEQQAKTLTRLFDDAYGAAAYAKDGRPGKAAIVAGRKIIGGMAHVVEIANQATENALRLALYMQLREQGVSPGKAAQAAKTVTVDFDRKGSQTGALGALYLFFNPAVQGAANAIKTLAQGEHKRQAWAALGALALLGVYAAAAGMDDDKDRWLGEGWETRSKNLILNIGGRQFRLPLSQEFAPVYGFGVAMTEAARGENKMSSAMRVVSSFIDAYFPFQGAFQPESDNHALDLALAMTPTVLKTPIQSAVNRNSFGTQIVPENEFTKDRPDNLKMNRATKNTAYDKTAQGIAWAGEVLTGAGKYENDITKVSPETLKNLWRTYTGGLGTFVTDTIGVAGMTATAPGQVEATDWPIVKDFVKAKDARAIRGRFYELGKEARRAAFEFKQADKAGDVDEMRRIMDDPEKSRLMAVGDMVSKVSKDAAEIRDLAVDVNADESLNAAEKRAKLKELDQQEEAIYREAIKAFQ